MYSQGWSEIRAEKRNIIKKVIMFFIGGAIMIVVSAELAFIIVG